MRPMGMGRARVAILFLAALTGCGMTGVTRAPTDVALASYALDGRFSLREEGRSYSGRVQWRHDQAGNRILVQDPFGGGVADLVDSPQGAKMKMASGETLVAASSQLLMHELTGIALPVADLGRWLTGRASGAKGSRRDAFGRMVRLESDGWDIAYSYDSDDADALPSLVVALGRNGLELKLRIESWGLPE